MTDPTTVHLPVYVVIDPPIPGLPALQTLMGTVPYSLDPNEPGWDATHSEFGENGPPASVLDLAEKVAVLHVTEADRLRRKNAAYLPPATAMNLSFVAEVNGLEVVQPVGQVPYTRASPIDILEGELRGLPPRVYADQHERTLDALAAFVEEGRAQIATLRKAYADIEASADSRDGEES